jgi:hypothetical protein
MARDGELPVTAISNAPPYACTQLAGEVMSVPRVWWHSTLNGPGETFALGTQEGIEELDAMSTDRLFSLTTQSLARLLNAKDYDGAEARAREIVERNPAELPVQASLAQLLMRRGKVAAAQKMMIAAVSHIRRLTMVTSPDGRVSGLLRTEDAAFADLRVAVSMANVGLDVTPAVTHALDVAPEYFPEQIVRKLLVALGNQLRHNKKGALPEWARALLQRGEVCLRSCPL